MLMHPRNTVLSAHHDGELSSSAAAQLVGHLNRCESCLVEYEKLSSAANAVRHLHTMRAPSHLAAKVRDQIDAVERGMVPVLRSEIQRSRHQSGFLAAMGLGTLATVFLVGLVFLLDHHYGEQARLTSAWIQSTLPEPVFLHETMSSPRFRDGSFSGKSFAEIKTGQDSQLLTMASIDRNGTLQGLEVIFRSGDEEMLTRALAAVRDTGFEPVRLGDQRISVNFLYFFTTTEVRPDGPRLSWKPAHILRTRA